MILELYIILGCLGLISLFGLGTFVDATVNERDKDDMKAAGLVLCVAPLLIAAFGLTVMVNNKPPTTEESKAALDKKQQELVEMCTEIIVRYKKDEQKDDVDRD